MYETIALQTDVIHPGDHVLDCISTDREFQNLIPAISDDERKQLEANIIEAGGVRDPLTLWIRDDNDWVILDGHNRFEICQRLRFPFPYHEVEFDTRDEAADWIDKNQLGRRNLSKRDYKLLLGRRYNRVKKAEHDGGKGKKRSGGQNAHHSEKTSERLAREHGVDEKTVRRAGEFQQAAEELGVTGDIARGTLHASEAEVVAAAKALPEGATDEQRQAARQQLKRRTKKPAKKSSKAKSSKSTPQPAVDPAAALREVIVKAWEGIKKKMAVADHRELRKVLAGIIREEQKQFDK